MLLLIINVELPEKRLLELSEKVELVSVMVEPEECKPPLLVGTEFRETVESIRVTDDELLAMPPPGPLVVEFSEMIDLLKVIFEDLSATMPAPKLSAELLEIMELLIIAVDASVNIPPPCA